MPLHRHVPREMREFHLDQLLGVDRPMPVPTGAHGLGQHHASSVHSLEDALQVHSPRDLPDEDRGKPFGTQLFVHAEEVDLHHLLGLGVNANMGRHRRDEANKFVALSYPHLEKKYLQPLFSRK